MGSLSVQGLDRQGSDTQGVANLILEPEAYLKRRVTDAVKTTLLAVPVTLCNPSVRVKSAVKVQRGCNYWVENAQKLHR